MESREMSGSWVFLPHNSAIGIVHFLGGAFVATAPHISYRSVLEQIAERGFAVIATPFLNTFNHFDIARDVLNRFETVVERLKTTGVLSSGYLPIYGLGHSMGCKIHLLIDSIYEVERIGNIFISFNNYPAKQAIPFFDRLDLPSTFDVEFEPCPSSTEKIIADRYSVRRNLLIKFDKDDIDQTLILGNILQKRFADMTAVKVLSGNHLTPLNQRIKWKMGDVYTPLDAIGQWFNQDVSRSLNLLNKELILWLDPASNF